ncbi:MAG: hypothetical protein APF81_01430 [Desulfosporosinus sp. BRH_c37]|nr:MAG: hypothetical protein APF81_01430 [Desulfosporosinus sp. BRH_c37]
MHFEGTPVLERFVLDYLQRVGALTEQVSYATLEVLLPEDVNEYFGEEQLRLVFDYEVAEETEGSLFITHGSSFLDKTVESILQNYGHFTVRYWSGPIPELPRNFEQKILANLEFRRCRPPKVRMYVVEECVFYGFNFRCTFRSHEKSEELVTIVLNGSNGQVQTKFFESWQKNIPAEEREYTLPRARLLPLDRLYQIACQNAEQATQIWAEKIMTQGAWQKKKELAKIAGYYGELAAEIQKKLAGTEDLKKKARLEQQLSATLVDRERREKDAAERYGVEVDISLDHVVAYYIPCLWVKLELAHKDQVRAFTVLFNPLSNEIETPVCERCERQTFSLVPEQDGFVCPECSVGN